MMCPLHTLAHSPAVALLGLALLAPASPAQTDWVETHAIVPPDSAYLDFFAKGHALALSGDRLAAGAPQKPVAPAPGQVVNAGRVEVHRRDGTGWALEAVLFEPGGPSLAALFGEALALQGDTLLVGAPQSSVAGFGGAAYVFTRDGCAWTPTASLVSAAPDTSKFGRAVALDGDVLAVAAPAALSGAQPAVSVFERDATGDWLPVAALHPPAGLTGTGFGTSLALAGERLAVGWPGAKRVALYTRDPACDWSLEHLLGPDDAPVVGSFGSDVELDRRRLVVGETIAGSIGYGVAHVFGLPDAEHQALLPSPAFSSTFFGAAGSLALRDDLIAVGATHDHTLGPSAGSVSLFRFMDGDWRLAQLLGNALPWSHFGSCELHEERLVVGAFGDDITAVAGPGRVHVFELADPLFDDLDGGLAGGCGAPLLAASGSLLPGSELALGLTGAASAAPLWIVAGPSLVWLPTYGGVLGPAPVVALGPLVSDAAGDAGLVLRWPEAGSVGGPWHVQAWVADDAGPEGWTASNVLTLVPPAGMR